MAEAVKKAQKGAPGKPFEAGHSKGGRPPGTPNKVPAAVKDMILQALSNVGGVAYLEKQASKNPQAFMTLVGKVLPLQVTGEGGGPIQYVQINTGIPRA